MDTEIQSNYSLEGNYDGKKQCYTILCAQPIWTKFCILCGTQLTFPALLRQNQTFLKRILGKSKIFYALLKIEQIK